MSGGLTLGIITFVGFCISFNRLPKKIQQWMTTHLVLTDVVVIMGMYSLFGMTLTAHFAAAWVVVFTQAYFYYVGNPDDFIWLEGIKKQLRDRVDYLKQWIKQRNEEYLANNPVRQCPTENK